MRVISVRMAAMSFAKLIARSMSSSQTRTASTSGAYGEVTESTFESCAAATGDR